MKETDSRGKVCVVPVAMIAGLGMAGMGLVSDGIARADTTSVTDTINVTVQPSCTFNSVEDKTYVGSAANGTEVNNFNDSGVHEFNLFCNDNNGFIVTATPYDLEADGIDDVIAYTDNYTHTGTNSMWTAVIASETPGVTVTSPAPVGGGTIISSDSSTTATGADFTATYSAYVGTATPAGTYTGTIVYTLTASGTSNNGNNPNTNENENENGGDSGTGGEGGDNSGNGQTDNNGAGGTGDDNGTGGESGTGGGATNDSSEPSNTPSNAPFAVNNTYNTHNTYSTSNTYSTTTYSGSGTGTTGTTIATNGNGNDVANNTSDENDDNEGGSGTNESYEQPLGVTTNTSSASSKKSEVDWTPLVVAGAIAVVGGAAAVALARSNKEEE